MTPKTVAKKNDIQKLQRAIVDGLEDVKAQDIVVFDTEHLSALFERVIVASGTSNRQTKALASSVVDAVREAGFGKPRVEGEGNGEWIIVDCGQAVVHVMQPNIRQYYHLEELWGEKPVRLKLGATKPVVSAPAKVVKEAKPAAKSALPNLKRSSAAKKGVDEAFPSKAQVKKNADIAAAAAKKAASRTSAKASAKTTARAPAKTPVKSAAKPAVKVIGKPSTKPPAKRTAPASARPKPAAKKATPRKA
ncbi:ribosome silencing factor [Rhodoferax sp.]|uniref:ribosome silencing factor n=1 Tax=Rhodoferax sp. TaxID=50421 RepID=UPI00275657BF|nr:ribosome silencing factor [Rhodoferax sp.]